MLYRLRVIRARCAPSGSLPQDRQRSTSRKRKARDSCWGKMHQSAWLKAIISCCGVWNVEEWSLWRNGIVYLFMFVVLILPSKWANFHKDWVCRGVLHLPFRQWLLCAVKSHATLKKHEQQKWRVTIKWLCYMTAGPSSRQSRAEQRLWMNTVSPFCNDVWNPKLIQMYDLPSLCLLSSNPAKPAPLLLAERTLLMKTTAFRRGSVLSSLKRREEKRREILLFFLPPTHLLTAYCSTSFSWVNRFIDI